MLVSVRLYLPIKLIESAKGAEQEKYNEKNGLAPEIPLVDFIAQPSKHRNGTKHLKAKLGVS